VLDPVVRDVLQARMDRHRRSRWWALFGWSRCRCCRFRWPCAAHLDARRTLDVAAGIPRRRAYLATEPQPWVGPLLTRGQEYRGGGWTA
jgi:predicted RecB family nuclease